MRWIPAVAVMMGEAVLSLDDDEALMLTTRLKPLRKASLSRAGNDDGGPPQPQRRLYTIELEYQRLRRGDT